MPACDRSSSEHSSRAGVVFSMTDQDRFRPLANSATVVVRTGKAKAAAKVKVTSSGLLAIGGLVSSILLSTAALVWVSTSVARRHPVATGLFHRR